MQRPVSNSGVSGDVLGRLDTWRDRDVREREGPPGLSAASSACQNRRVAQSTLVVTLKPPEQVALEKRLAAGDFDFRPLAHARFSARGEGVVATLYTSGKLVVQGNATDVFAARYLEHAGARSEPARAARKASHAIVIGSDESGKGDYFGPLVVAAVRLEAGESDELEGGPVRDSKRLDDASCRRLGAALRGRFPHAVRKLDPPQYNAEHARIKNLNPILARLHAEVIRELFVPGAHVVVDQFERAGRVARALGGLAPSFEERPRAEEVPAVAAASVIAREQFLTSIDELGETWAVDLCKGAGAPTDRAARRFVALHGFDALGSVAKLHFKNTAKIRTKGRS